MALMSSTFGTPRSFASHSSTRCSPETSTPDQQNTRQAAQQPRRFSWSTGTTTQNQGRTDLLQPRHHHHHRRRQLQQGRLQVLALLAPSTLRVLLALRDAASFLSFAEPHTKQPPKQ